MQKINLAKGIHFVSGIDTDAGKSYVTGILARELNRQGVRTITQKFIQTGGENTDILLHRRLMGTGMLPEDLDGTTAPLIFSYPASPHLAAALDGREIDFGAIDRSAQLLAARYDVVLMEGAGGLHVPLKEFYTTLDYIEEKQLPLLFVTSGKLGSINHTLLSLETCRQRGIKVEMLIYNHFFDDDRTIAEDTQRYLQGYLHHYHPQSAFIEIDSESV